MGGGNEETALGARESGGLVELRAVEAEADEAFDTGDSRGKAAVGRGVEGRVTAEDDQGGGLGGGKRSKGGGAVCVGANEVESLAVGIELLIEGVDNRVRGGGQLM